MFEANTKRKYVFDYIDYGEFFWQWHFLFKQETLNSVEAIIKNYFLSTAQVKIVKSIMKHSFLKFKLKNIENNTSLIFSI